MASRWLASTGCRTPPTPGQAVSVQLRHRAPAVAASVVESPIPDNMLRLGLHGARRAVTPGQSAVVLQGERVLGGGRIVRAIRILGATG
jgi:tRNA-specific 2-thiouridylase